MSQGSFWHLSRLKFHYMLILRICCTKILLGFGTVATVLKPD
jgi:hypothetical protein